MKKQLTNIWFISICMAVCLIPFGGMIVKKTDSTTENRSLMEWPKLVREDHTYNVNYLEQAGAFFEDHFALKNEMVAADSLLLTKLFKQSPVETVLLGTDDWLYYTSSLDDYKGMNVVSEREAYHIAHNLRIVQDRLEQDGMAFAFTIAPNKNSLYDENMPYYERIKAAEVNNVDMTKPLFSQLGVNYIDLYDVFQSQGEILYRKQDSHWNGKGAVLAYNKILEELGKEHDDFSEMAVTRVRIERGDLGTALYSVAAKPDWDYRYEYEPTITYVTDTESWEDFWVQTECTDKEGSLLMFRDSFGNTLAPLLAEAYGSAAFSRDNVYHLDSNLEMAKPDTVLFEIVERNLRRFGEVSQISPSSGPPIMTPPVADKDISTAVTVESMTTATAEFSTQQMSMVCVSGWLDETYMDAETNVYVEVTKGTESILYEAYTFTDPERQQDNGYMFYLNASDFPDQSFGLKVYADNKEGNVVMLLDKQVVFE